MAVIVTRAGKGSPLTNAEVDQNFINLNAGRFETVPVVINAASPTPPPVPIDASVLLQLVGPTGLGARLEMDGYAGSPQFNTRRANGTAAAPTAVKAGDGLAVFSGRGYGATGWSASNRAVVSMLAAENWTDTAQGSEIQFQTTPLGSIATATVWKFTSEGHLLPGGAGVFDIGLPTFRVRTLYAGTADFTGSVGAAGMFTSPFLQINGYGSAPIVYGFSANGTQAAPIPTTAYQQLLVMTGRGRAPNGTSSGGASITFQASEDYTNGRSVDHAGDR
jgi:hypothetical protein